MTDEAKIVCDTADLCGEAPLWLPDCQTLAWADQGRGTIHALRDGVHRELARGFSAGGLVRAGDGTLIATGPDGLALLKGGVVTRLAPDPLQGVCLNDACAGPDGRLIVGRMSLTVDGSGIAAPGALLSIERADRVRVVDDDVLIPNGMGLSPDDRSLYVVDSGRRQVLAYPADDLDRRRPLRRRVVVGFGVDDGVPDGLAVDCDGNLWVAMWYGGQVVCVSPDGRILHRVVSPFPQVSSVAFGGRDRRALYITTAGAPWRSTFAPAGWSPQQVQGGPLLRVPSRVQGLPVHEVRFH